ncbi:sugar ABC transporter ATP-binding protein [Streptomyces lydicus]|uniref:sugar ABC transporter ATP-binding protein n=1 Tax=Streptomyces lydicus TaxID=47763 RepID=UPI000691E2CA|nr:sugar ABC transporter ATP-binding protein [Streptomyces lydicus]MDC7339159.1 sugar ABC transporter ATP-binding protein [Streptomyces lydicus]UEG91332.1 sugar ABC transporter ATP-binding protein [Streptomyces lydicus]
MTGVNDDVPGGRELLRVEGVTKSFPGVRALDGVDLSLRTGEVHVLLGENGAGKSTLIKMLSGAHRPDGGRILVDGRPGPKPGGQPTPRTSGQSDPKTGGQPDPKPNTRPGIQDGAYEREGRGEREGGAEGGGESAALREVQIRSAQDAERLGIATIYQEFNLVPGLTVAENIFLGRQPRTALGLVDKKTMYARAAELLARVRLDVSPRTPVGELGIARLQMVEIAKALSLEARVLIMDEPTAVLTSEEVETLFTIVRELRDAGVGIIFITHHLEEIGALGDRVTVLRDGRSVAEVPASTDEDELIRLMVGRDITEQYPRRRPDEPDEPEEPGAPLLRVRGLTRNGAVAGVPVFADIDFEVRAGEVVGLAGLVGAGRTEVARAVFGVDRYDAGTVEIDGAQLARGDVRAAMRAGLGLVPEDRKGQGLVLDASLQDNLTLARLDRDTRGGLVDRSAQRRSAAAVAEQLKVRMSGLAQPARTLSGGNQQKLVIGKWLLADTRLLILDEPTRGIDVGAKVEIYQLINELTASGRAVLMISSDLPEVLGMSDRVLVMSQGRLAGELSADEATQDAVMELALQPPGGNPTSSDSNTSSDTHTSTDTNTNTSNDANESAMEGSDVR